MRRRYYDRHNGLYETRNNGRRASRLYEDYDDFDESYRPSCGSKLFERIMLRENYDEATKDACKAIVTEFGNTSGHSDEELLDIEWAVYTALKKYQKEGFVYETNKDSDEAGNFAANTVEEFVNKGIDIRNETIQKKVWAIAFLRYLKKCLVDTARKTQSQALAEFAIYLNDEDNRQRVEKNLMRIAVNQFTAINMGQARGGTYLTMDNSQDNTKKTHEPGTEFDLFQHKKTGELKAKARAASNF